MKFNILTLFPEMFEPLNQSILKILSTVHFIYTLDTIYNIIHSIIHFIIYYIYCYYIYKFLPFS